MQYLLLAYIDEADYPKMSDAEHNSRIASYIAFAEALGEAGALVATNRLKPSTAATMVRLKDGRSQVLDGPYADAKEQIGGYFLIEAADLDAALAWAARCPAASHGAVEVRPIWPV